MDTIELLQKVVDHYGQSPDLDKFDGPIKAEMFARRKDFAKLIEEAISGRDAVKQERFKEFLVATCPFACQLNDPV